MISNRNPTRLAILTEKIVNNATGIAIIAKGSVLY